MDTRIGALGGSPFYCLLRDRLFVFSCLDPPDLAAGFMFGMTWGTVTSSLGATLGAMAAFLIARVMLQGRIEHRLATHPNFLRIDRAISVKVSKSYYYPTLFISSA